MSQGIGETNPATHAAALEGQVAAADKQAVSMQLASSAINNRFSLKREAAPEKVKAITKAEESEDGGLHAI